MKRAYTLLELLLALSLMIIVLSLVWMLMRLYSRDYIVAENKVARSQLVRSLARLLDDDLAATIGDPIHPLLANDTTESGLIRRFGIRGGPDWLTIDVVAPNLLTEEPAARSKAVDDEQVSSSSVSRREKQVPELKTIFYRFVAPGARQTSDTTATAVDGSEIIGSLQLPPGSSRVVPLVTHYGLSRRELDFETPETENDSPSEAVESLTKIGSLDPNIPTLDVSKTENAVSRTSAEPTTSEEVAMDRESGADWAPEVIDCRFRYFDGQTWRDSWDSIKENTPPLAVSVTLVLLPLDQVNLLRMSPEYLTFCSSEPQEEEGTDLGSRFAGNQVSNQVTENGPQATRPTLETITETLGLNKPLRREIVSRLATSPLSRHNMPERQKPLGTTRYDRPEAGGERRWQETSRLPGPDRMLPERNARDRIFDDRMFEDTDITSRTFDERIGIERRETEQTFQERLLATPTEDPLFEAIDSVQALFEEGVPTLEPAAETTPVVRPTAPPNQPQSWIRNPK